MSEQAIDAPVEEGNSLPALPLRPVHRIRLNLSGTELNPETATAAECAGVAKVLLESLWHGVPKFKVEVTERQCAKYPIHVLIQESSSLPRSQAPVPYDQRMVGYFLGQLQDQIDDHRLDPALNMGAFRSIPDLASALQALVDKYRYKPELVGKVIDVRDKAREESSSLLKS